MHNIHSFLIGKYNLHKFNFLFKLFFQTSLHPILLADLDTLIHCTNIPVEEADSFDVYVPFSPYIVRIKWCTVQPALAAWKSAWYFKPETINSDCSHIYIILRVALIYVPLPSQNEKTGISRAKAEENCENYIIFFSSEVTGHGRCKDHNIWSPIPIHYTLFFNI